jgi:hypothetical protein
MFWSSDSREMEEEGSCSSWHQLELIAAAAAVAVLAISMWPLPLLMPLLPLLLVTEQAR